MIANSASTTSATRATRAAATGEGDESARLLTGGGSGRVPRQGRIHWQDRAVVCTHSPSDRRIRWPKGVGRSGMAGCYARPSARRFRCSIGLLIEPKEVRNAQTAPALDGAFAPHRRPCGAGGGRGGHQGSHADHSVRSARPSPDLSGAGAGDRCRKRARGNRGPARRPRPGLRAPPRRLRPSPCRAPWAPGPPRSPGFFERARMAPPPRRTGRTRQHGTGFEPPTSLDFRARQPHRGATPGERGQADGRAVPDDRHGLWRRAGEAGRADPSANGGGPSTAGRWRRSSGSS